MGDYTEYAVTFLSGELSEYRSFETAADAERCVQALRPLLHHPPLYALEQFMLAGLVTRSWPLDGLVRLDRLASGQELQE